MVPRFVSVDDVVTIAVVVGGVTLRGDAPLLDGIDMLDELGHLTVAASVVALASADSGFDDDATDDVIVAVDCATAVASRAAVRNNGTGADVIALPPQPRVFCTDAVVANVVAGSDGDGNDDVGVGVDVVADVL